MNIRRIIVSHLLVVVDAGTGPSCECNECQTGSGVEDRQNMHDVISQPTAPIHQPVGGRERILNGRQPAPIRQSAVRSGEDPRVWRPGRVTWRRRQILLRHSSRFALGAHARISLRSVRAHVGREEVAQTSNILFVSMVCEGWLAVVQRPHVGQTANHKCPKDWPALSVR